MDPTKKNMDPRSTHPKTEFPKSTGFKLQNVPSYDFENQKKQFWNFYVAFGINFGKKRKMEQLQKKKQNFQNKSETCCYKKSWHSNFRKL